VTQFDLAVSLSTLATSIERAGHDDEAAALYSRSLAIRQQLSESDPKDVLARAKTGYIQMRLARVELALGHAARARELAQSSVAIQEDVLQKTSDKISRRDLAAALYVLGLAERTLKQGTRTCELIGRAVAGFEATSPSTYLDDLQSQAESALRACRGGTTAAR
jgi:hypothetical protein